MANDSGSIATCPTVRRRRVVVPAADAMPGDPRPPRVEWRSEPCATPLYGSEVAAGMCRGCATGWKSPGNYPAGSPPEERWEDDPFGPAG